LQCASSAQCLGFNLRGHQTIGAQKEARTAAVVLTTAARHDWEEGTRQVQT
jgi:hypothetical protein